MNEFRPAFADHVRILRVEFHRTVDAPGLFAGNECASRTSEEIKNHLSGLAGIEHRLAGKRGRLLCRMHIFAGVVPLNVPYRRLTAVTEPFAIFLLMAAIKTRIG